MLTSFRGRLAVSLAALACGLSSPALAQDETDADGVTVSANVSLVTDYRFRGVSLSGGDPAIQGGLDIAHDSGFYAGVWASSIDGGPSYGEMEFDIYGGWSGQLSEGVSVDVGLLYYLYPSEELGLDTDYWEPYASIGFNLGPAEATVGAAYAWEQDSLGGDDNLYIYTDLSTGLPGTPLTVTGHLGYTDGVLAPPLLAGDTDETGIDWSIGASYAAGPLEVGISYVGVEGPSIDGFTDDAIVGTVTASF
ncbi:TorF family putative porin [Qipengyuania sp. GH38]|uniref:TorF family putative porin n=1 Tax=Qipengyuania intermedia TaxID=2867244 RepID=UPI001C88448F|nr:TorF family putative porin [Qipengyuania intermedia]MBX7514560.1 TorF family putative porin [Qipengyuania intermedia]